MKVVDAAARTIFPELQSLGIALSVLSSCICPLLALGAGKMNDDSGFTFFGHRYSMMRLKVPAPTVLPPSRIAKRKPVSRATG